MNKKLALLIIATALLGLVISSFKIQNAKASGIIYIMADGRIDPSDVPISSADNITYTFTGNVNNAIVVERNNIIVDGDGHTLEGNKSGYGIDISYRTNVTIKNMNIKAFFNGIYLSRSTYNSIIGNNITINIMSGIRLFRLSYYNIICRNNITKNANGIGLVDSVDNRIFENNIQYNGRNIELYGCYSNCIYHNNFMINATQVQAYSYNKNNLSDYWDSGYPSGGNYWNNYDGADLLNGPYQNATGSDGIADSAVVINEKNEKNRDHYPLKGMFYSFITSYGWSVSVISNSSIINPTFSLVNQPNAVLSFNISGENQTQGFCRICIPKALINGPYTVTFDNKTIYDPQVRELPCSNTTHEYLYINYTHSEHAIEISGTTTIPEHFQFVVFPLLMITALLAGIICRKSSKLSVQS